MPPAVTVALATIMVAGVLAGVMPSSQMPAPWLTAWLPLLTLLLKASLPKPSVSTPPPASPARLSVIVLLLIVSAHLVLTVFSMETPPPSAVAALSVRTMLFSVRSTGPTSRMPPPLPNGPSALPPVASNARPFSMVKPCIVTANRGPAGIVPAKLKAGSMSKTRARSLPLTVTWPPLVLLMVRLVLLLLVPEMANSPAALSVSFMPAVGGSVIW